MPNVLGDGQIFAEPENWLFEAITETYIPLFKALSRWDPKTHPGKKIVFSMTPCLVDQLIRCRERYIRYLHVMKKIACFEVERTSSAELFARHERWGNSFTSEDFKLFNKTATTYVDRINEALTFMENHELIPFMRKVAAEKPDNIELWTSTPDHNFLPFFNSSTQEHLIKQGVERFAEVFQQEPDGMWLPECAFRPGVEKHLVSAGIKQTALTPHAIGVFHPDIKSGIYQHEDLSILVHDHRLSMHLWKMPEDTLPSNPVYREFYRDVGMDVTAQYFKDLGIALNESQSEGVWTGIKYLACSTSDVKLASKPAYDPAIGEKQAQEDATKFVKIMDEKRVHAFDQRSMIVAFDTELFGHWWHEGVQWLDNLLHHDLDACE